MNSLAYAKILNQELSGKSEGEIKQISSKFLEVLKEKDDIYLLPRILKDLSRLSARRKLSELVFIKTALGLNDEERIAHINEIKKEMGLKDGESIRFLVDENLIGGSITVSKEKMVDRSYKKNLLELFKSIIQK